MIGKYETAFMPAKKSKRYILRELETYYILADSDSHDAILDFRRKLEEGTGFQGSSPAFFALRM